MKKSIVFVKTIMVASLLFVGCSNDNSPNCPQALTGELDATETAFVGDWSFMGMVSEKEIDLTDDNEDNPSTNIYDQFEECQQDLIYSFENDRSYSLKQGYVATNCTNKVQLNGTWKLTGGVLSFVTNCSTNYLNIEFNNDKTEFTFEETYKFVDVDGQIITSKVTFTYGKMTS
ncbi:DUF5004 domain-containing protein [Yeosuana marina]|uniref:DUF5004 domain-containing protein n=1 Tax=Yeosuana marina TaxID=1565536 RepID=UPI00142400C4|nr:DUF5004 domain-containing protein [Yeosuana marina]